MEGKRMFWEDRVASRTGGELMVHSVVTCAGCCGGGARTCLSSSNGGGGVLYTCCDVVMVSAS